MDLFVCTGFFVAGFFGVFLVLISFCIKVHEECEEIYLGLYKGRLNKLWVLMVLSVVHGGERKKIRVKYAFILLMYIT